MTAGDFQSIHRRGAMLLGAASVAAVLLPAQRAAAQDNAAAGAIAPIQRLDAALLTAMKQGQRTPFVQRYQYLEPVVEQTFDLPSVLAASVGLSWASMPEAAKQNLLAAFRRYTVSSYAANFDSYAGQRFDIAPAPRQLNATEVVVATKLVPANGSPTALDYVMRNGPGGWKAVDVLADGSISRVAVQRSDFRHLLSSGGVPALVSGLRNKVASLSGGMLA